MAIQSGGKIIDVSVYRPSAGAWYLLNSSNNSFSGTQFGISADKLAPADYDGDGKTDISVYRPSAGAWYRLNSSNNQFFGQQFGTAEDKPVAANNASRVFYVNTGANLTLNSMTITNGKGTGTTNPDDNGAGGGIFNNGVLAVINSTVSGNEAEYSGAGIYNYFSGRAALTNSTVSGNVANYEGGIANHNSLTLINTTVTNNRASLPCGAGLCGRYF